MDIIDSQVHIWDSNASQRVPNDDPRRSILMALLARPVTAEVQLAAMDAVGVEATVANIPRSVYRRRRDDGCFEYDNGYADEAARRHPGRLYSVAWVDATAPDVDDSLASLQERPGMVGIRQRVAAGDGLAELSEGSWDRFFKCAGRLELPVFLVAEGSLEALHPVIHRFPDVQFVIDHFGLPVPHLRPVESGSPFDQLPSLLALAQHTNVAVKWGGAQRLSAAPYPYVDLWPHLRKVVAAFGVDRLMFASDWTVTRDQHSYAEAVFHLRETNELSVSEKRKIFAGTARRLLRLDGS
jgi:predicted TIM-barrel fold metal-dependent hydrolase